MFISLLIIIIINAPHANYTTPYYKSVTLTSKQYVMKDEGSQWLCPYEAILFVGCFHGRLNGAVSSGRLYSAYKTCPISMLTAVANASLLHE